MCWSGKASLVMGMAGMTLSYIEYQRRDHYRFDILDKHVLRCVMIFYFSIMEFIQSLNYLSISVFPTINGFTALLAYFHIGLQALFYSLFVLSLIPYQRRIFWFKYTLVFSALTYLSILLRLVYSPTYSGCFGQGCTRLNNIYDILNLPVALHQTIGCSNHHFIAYKGDWHIAWQWVLNNCTYFGLLYTINVHFFPALFGAYRAMIYLALVGPILSVFLTHNPDEWPAIWCFHAIAIVLPFQSHYFERFFQVTQASWKSQLRFPFRMDDPMTKSR